jgi:hypothetical protein
MGFFQEAKLTKSLVARILAKIRKVEFALPPGELKMDEVVFMDESYMDRFARYFVDEPSGYIPQEKKGTLADLSRQVLAFRVGQVVLYVHATTLKKQEPIMRTVLVKVSNGNRHGEARVEVWLVDESIASAAESKLHMLDFLSRAIGSSKDFKEKWARMLTSYRSGLGAELNDLNTLFFCPEFRTLKNLSWVSQFSCQSTSDLDHFHWSTEPLVETEEPELLEANHLPEPFVKTGNTAFRQEQSEVEDTPYVDVTVGRSALFSGIGFAIIILITLFLSLNN